MNLASTIPDGGFESSDDALDAFLTWTSEQGLELYEHQEEAILELFAGNHVLLKTPTGSGKSLVALAMHFRELAAGTRSVYTAPIKALVSEKFLNLCDTFGAENVGMSTGDGTVNRDAPILCCTAEVLSQIALRHGEDTPYDAVVMDEFHFFGDRDRGMAWQLPLLTMPQARFLLMSATLGDTSAIERDLEDRTGTSVAAVTSAKRPVPLDYVYSDMPVDDRLYNLVSAELSPVYAVHFTQRAATERAQALLSTNFCTADEKAEIKKAVKGFRFDSPFGPTLRRMILHGIAVHHAGLLPKYRLLVEKLSQRGLFKVICGTDTLGVGINVPIRTVLFTQLCKFDGESVDLLTVRDFKQIAGRAGRKGFDTQGTVVAQAPEWVIENAKLERAIEGGKKRSKVKKKKPPTRGYRHWDEETFQRLIERPAEALTPRFKVDHGFVLRLLQKAEETLEEPLEDLDELVDLSHATRKEKERLKEAGRERLDELLRSGVVTDAGEDAVPRYHVDSALQADFSLHHSLSLYLLHVLDELPADADAHALDMVTMVESILEHPRAVLFAQANRAKTQAIGAMKAEGIPYEERIEALEEITWPKPHAEWIYETFNGYQLTHPWLTGDPIRPKSVVREMFETQAVFSSYVKELRLERGEGVLLRYLAQAYKAIVQNIPEHKRTDDLLEVIGYLRALLARVDDSLISAWKAMAEGETAEEAERPIDISQDKKAFRARVRAELHALVRCLSKEDWTEAAASVRGTEEAWTAKQFEKALAPYLEERGEVLFDGRTRLGHNTVIQQVEPHLWHVSQVLVDDADDDDVFGVWSVSGVVDLRGDTNPSGALVEVNAVGE
ncbi:MAG: DUF3516 domain-containing protein [Proteobacteria bacterium]|nr:DUF3516 domain-containing protein [Pseudomonadota bacterium]